MRKKKKDSIDLDLLGSTIQKADVQIEHLKDYVMQRRIDKFSQEEKISLWHLENVTTSHTYNHWIDYWIQSGALYKIFQTNIGELSIRNLDKLLKTPEYALVILCMILETVSDTPELSEYIHRCILNGGDSHLTLQDKVKIEEQFMRQQDKASLSSYWVLFSEALSAWERGEKEVESYNKAVLKIFMDIIHDCYCSPERLQYSSSESYGTWNFEDESGEEISEEEYEKELQDDFYNLEECGADILLMKITFERFTGIFKDLFTKMEELSVEPEEGDSDDKSFFLKIRSVYFAPYLGSFFIGLKHYCKHFPFNPSVSILDEAAEEAKKTRLPKAYIELKAYIKFVGHGGFTKTIWEDENIKKNGNKSFWEQYFIFCVCFFKEIIEKDRRFKRDKNMEESNNIYYCFQDKDWGNYPKYKECIIYVFERVFAYYLFTEETKTIIIELFKHAIKMLTTEEIMEEELLCVRGKIEELWMRVDIVDAFGSLMGEIYENQGIYIRMKQAPEIIKKWLDDNLHDDETSYKYVESGINNYNFTFLDLFFEWFLGYMKTDYALFKKKERSIYKIEDEVSKIELELDISYRNFEDRISKINERSKEEIINVGMDIINDLMRDICKEINEIENELGDRLWKRNRGWMMTLFDEVLYWVAKTSFQFEKVDVKI